VTQYFPLAVLLDLPDICIYNTFCGQVLNAVLENHSVLKRVQKYDPMCINYAGSKNIYYLHTLCRIRRLKKI